MQFRVDPEQIRDHSRDVFGYVTRLQAAKDAAETTMSTDAFGPMLAFFATSPPELATTTRDSLGDRTSEMDDAVDNLRSHANTHDTNDQNAVDNVIRTLK